MITFEENAFSDLEEYLVWLQDEAPHLRSAFRATVLASSAASASAGPSTDRFPANAYSVVVDFRTTILAKMKMGDMIKREDGTLLTIQQITHEHGVGATLICTAEEMPEK